MLIAQLLFKGNAFYVVSVKIIGRLAILLRIQEVMCSTAVPGGQISSWLSLSIQTLKYTLACVAAPS